MDTNGVAWTVILNRGYGVVDFASPGWNVYAQQGVGNPAIEHFLALEYLHLLTSGKGDIELMV